MTVKDVNEEINKLIYYAKTIDKMTNQPFIMDCDVESLDILMDMVERLPSIACTMEILLDNSIIKGTGY